MFLDTPGQLRGQFAIEARVLGIAKTPQHMLKAVWRVEQNEEETFAEAVEFEEHHLLALSDDQGTLGKISLFVKAPVVEPVVIFGHPQCGVWANTLSQFFRILSGRRNRKGRRCG